MKDFVLILTCIVCVGSVLYSNHMKSNTNTPSPTIPSSLARVTTEFNKIPVQEDKEFLHLMFVGAQRFLERSSFTGDVNDFDAILEGVKESYEWKRDVVEVDGESVILGKYKDFSIAIADFLIERGQDEYRLINDANDRMELAQVFSDLAKATEL